MKRPLLTALSFLVISGTVFGQAANAPVVVRHNVQDNVAVVNGEAISRSSLAAECLQLHGTEVLQELINNTLIQLESARRNISITAEEVNAEILRRAQNFRMTTDELLRLIEEQRGISPQQQRDDIARRLLLVKLARDRIEISPEELQTKMRMEYDRNFGAAVQARQIILANRAEAEAVRAEVMQHPGTFASIAMNRSVCPATAPFAGMIHPPIRRHTFHPEIENMLFAMQPGEVSQVVDFPLGHFTVFRVEQLLQPLDVRYEAVQEQLYHQVIDARLPQIAQEILLALHDRAQVKVIFGDPALHHQHPGVAAFLHDGQNWQSISNHDLAEACIRRFGNGVLSDMINRRIVEQAARQQNIIITEQDIDNEIREMAFKYLPLLSGGVPNVRLWIERAMEETGLSEAMYRRNVVVPVLSLKRLTRPFVQVTEEDIRRAYEANFGPRVQCLMIVFEARDQRRAMEIWQRANANRTETFFGDLAERYSFDPVSRAGRGVFPPIARHTGHPELEYQAFKLQPGGISPIFQVLDKLVILYCVGHENPQPIPLEDVRANLIIDIFEKKQQHIIALHFERLFEQSSFVNHLTGETQIPVQERAMQDGGSRQR